MTVVAGSLDRTSALAVVCEAVAIVCEVDAATLSADTTFAELDADSLVLVGIADVVEATLAEQGRELHIDDASLGRMRSLGDVVDYILSSAG
ncbi:MAG TPA: phosphopantetheine-binding protein [Mycobacteriales bacterium]|nr:phosphopantetheine-binding protein [Mycobacteriales bacterium]